jgi:hypothetical protein
VFLDLLNDWSWDNVASIVARIWARQPGYHISITGKMKIILFTKAPRPGLGPPIQTTTQWVLGGSFLGG